MLTEMQARVRLIFPKPAHSSSHPVILPMLTSSELKASPGLLSLTNLLGALDTFELGGSSDEEGKEKAGEVKKRKGKGAKEEEVPPAAPAPLQRANSLEELVLKVGMHVSEHGMWHGRILA